MSNIMDDLGELIFGDDLASEAMFRGAALEHGAILDRRFEQGRPGVAGEYRPQIREGSADHGTVYIRTSEGAFSSGKASYPKVGEVIQVKESETDGFEPWRIRLKRGPEGGMFELLCELEGSRSVNTHRGNSGGRRISE